MMDGFAGCESATDEDNPTLTEDFYLKRLNDLRLRVDARRLEHIEGVAACSLQLARVYGVDERRAHLAGLLHDWDKGMDDAQIRARADDLGLDIDPLIYEVMPRVMHGMTAACALAREYPAMPSDVLQAIDRHTVAAKDMSDLDMVVYIADALEPGRRFGRVPELRKLIGTVELEELFFQVYGYWLELLIERGKQMHPATIEIWNHYAARSARRNGRRVG